MSPWRAVAGRAAFVYTVVGLIVLAMDLRNVAVLILLCIVLMAGSGWAMLPVYPPPAEGVVRPKREPGTYRPPRSMPMHEQVPGPDLERLQKRVRENRIHRPGHIDSTDDVPPPF
jgi:hypothetical protein